MGFKIRKPPTIKGKDAERFKLRKRINEIRLDISLLKLELIQLEDELKELDKN